MASDHPPLCVCVCHFLLFFFFFVCEGSKGHCPTTITPNPGAACFFPFSSFYKICCFWCLLARSPPALQRRGVRPLDESAHPRRPYIVNLSQSIDRSINRSIDRSQNPPTCLARNHTKLMLKSNQNSPGELPQPTLSYSYMSCRGGGGETSHSHSPHPPNTHTNHPPVSQRGPKSSLPFPTTPPPSLLMRASLHPTIHPLISMYVQNEGDAAASFLASPIRGTEPPQSDAAATRGKGTTPVRCCCC